MNKSRGYKIEYESHGRCGWTFYIEQGRLPFEWEIIVGGMGVEIPLPEKWDAYCEKHKANWAKGRRNEIVQRLAEGLIKKWYWFGNGTYEIFEGPGLISIQVLRCFQG
jgi:hypothetical protein